MTVTSRGAHEDVRPEAPVPGIPRSLPRSLAVHDILAIGPGAVPFGVMLGVTINGTGMGKVAGLAGAALVYAGSAQLTTVTMLGMGASALTAVASGAVVNLRMLLYGAALAPRYRDQPFWFRLAGPMFLVDQTYVSAVARPELRGGGFRRYWLWLGGLLLLVWSAAVTTGLYVGPLLPPLPHIGLVGVGLFLAMLVPRLVGRGPVVAAAAGAAAGLATYRLLPQLAVMAGAVIGVAAAMAVDRWDR